MVWDISDRVALARPAALCRTDMKTMRGCIMANLEINIPDALYERLCHVAGERDCTVGDFALAVVQRELEWLEWKERWARLPVSHRTVSAATMLEEARAERDKELESSTLKREGQQ